MRYRSLKSLLPLLTLSTGNANIDQLMPELAQMVNIVERNLGLSEDALHQKTALRLKVCRSFAELPADFFREQEILDYCLDPLYENDITACTCNCDPCHCGYTLYTQQCGTFHFHDVSLECPFKTGTVSFTYWAIECDAMGLPMVLDDHVDAFIAFVNKYIKKGQMNAGEINPNIYLINKEDWKEEALFTRSRRVPKKRNIKNGFAITTFPRKFL